MKKSINLNIKNNENFVKMANPINIDLAQKIWLTVAFDKLCLFKIMMELREGLSEKTI